MLGKRTAQPQLFDVGNVFDLTLPAHSFHAQLAQAAARLFVDEDFAALYADKKGRPSVPPSLLALTVLLQQQAVVSDEEAIERTAYDLRWCVVLGKAAGEPLCAKSSLQLFRAHLILHEKAQQIFLTSIQEAKRAGLLKGAIRAAIDTKPIVGRGAVQDTFNLLARGILQLARALARQHNQNLAAFLQDTNLTRYQADSLKGSVDLDWADEAQKQAFLTQVVADARHLLGQAVGAEEPVRQAAHLLEALLLQDVEEGATPEGAPVCKIKSGTASGRLPSVTDPEQRHGRKSQTKTFTGHKASVATDIDSQILVAVEVIAGDAPDNSGALELVEQAQINCGLPVTETLGDCAYGDGGTRQAFAEAGKSLYAKVPTTNIPAGRFPKGAFTIDLNAHSVTCPAGHTLTQGVELPDGSVQFRFRSLCRDCPLRQRCTPTHNGRTLTLHPQEALLQAARDYQHSAQGKAHLRERVVVEHGLARLSHLGIGQARYLGRAKTRFQLLMAATVANLRRTWNWQTNQRQTALFVARYHPWQTVLQTARIVSGLRIIHLRSRELCLAV